MLRGVAVAAVNEVYTCDLMLSTGLTGLKRRSQDGKFRILSLVQKMHGKEVEGRHA